MKNEDNIIQMQILNTKDRKRVTYSYWITESKKVIKAIQNTNWWRQ